MVRWGFAGVAISDNTSMTVAGSDYGTEITVDDTQQTINFEQLTPQTAAVTLGNTPVDNDIIFIRVRRLGAAAGDTFDQEAQLLGIQFEILTDSGEAA